MRKKYLDRLGLPLHASLEDVKRAYKRKAKQYHPDINSSPNAQAEFVLIKEAYEYLIRPKPVQQTQSFRTTNVSRDKAYSPKPPLRKQKHQEPTGSDHFNRVMDAVYLVLTVVFVIFIPIIGYITQGFLGLIACLFLLLVSSKMILSSLQNYRIAKVQKLIESIIYLKSNDKFIIGFLSVLNVVLFFAVSLKHLIPLMWMGVLFVLIPIITLLILFRLKYEKMKSYLYALAYLPFALNTIFVLNYHGGQSNVVETYRIYNTEGKPWELNDNTLLKLENNAYDEYLWLRFFPNYREIYGKEKVSIIFIDGTFGIKALKSYRFL